MRTGNIFIIRMSLHLFNRIFSNNLLEYLAKPMKYIKYTPLNLSSFFLAFAELQTDMTDLTADLESSGIPTLDHKNYIMKVFFPGVSDHPILNDPKVR